MFGDLAMVGPAGLRNYGYSATEKQDLRKCRQFSRPLRIVMHVEGRRQAQGHGVPNPCCDLSLRRKLSNRLRLGRKPRALWGLSKTRFVVKGSSHAKRASRRLMWARLRSARKRAHRRDNFPQQLSGGLQQRAAAWSPIPRSSSLTGSLEAAHGAAVTQLLALRKEAGTTTVKTTHSPADTATARSTWLTFTWRQRMLWPQNMRALFRTHDRAPVRRSA